MRSDLFWKNREGETESENMHQGLVSEPVSGRCWNIARPPSQQHVLSVVEAKRQWEEFLHSPSSTAPLLSFDVSGNIIPNSTAAFLVNEVAVRCISSHSRSTSAAHRFSFSCCGLTLDSVHLIASAVREATAPVMLDVSYNSFDESEIVALARALRRGEEDHSHCHRGMVGKVHLNIQGNTLTQKGFNELLSSSTNSSIVESIDMTLPAPFTDEACSQMCAALSNCTSSNSGSVNCISFDCRGAALPPEFRCTLTHAAASRGIALAFDGLDTPMMTDIDEQAANNNGIAAASAFVVAAADPRMDVVLREVAALRMELEQLRSEAAAAKKRSRGKTKKKKKVVVDENLVGHMAAARTRNTHQHHQQQQQQLSSRREGCLNRTPCATLSKRGLPLSLIH